MEGADRSRQWGRQHPSPHPFLPSSGAFACCHVCHMHMPAALFCTHTCLTCHVCEPCIAYMPAMRGIFVAETWPAGMPAMPPCHACLPATWPGKQAPFTFPKLSSWLLSHMHACGGAQTGGRRTGLAGRKGERKFHLFSLLSPRGQAVSSPCIFTSLTTFYFCFYF